MNVAQRLSAIFVAIALSAISCQTDRQGNRQPAILSLTAYPDSIGPTDSTKIVCIAQDPDHDVLVFDWITDNRLIIQGTRPNESWLYNTTSNTRTFYPGPASFGVVDTGWVQCFARDGRGMSDSRIIHILVHR